MARPVVGALAELVYAELGVWATQDEVNDWALLKFVGALTGPVEAVYERVRETDEAPSWSILLDPELTPAENLPYLAQFVGVTLTESMTVAEQRAAITAPTGFARGTLAALQTVIGQTLTGTQRVVIYERTPTPYTLTVRTLTTETPDEDLTEAVVRASKPAGLVLDYQAVDGLTYTDLDANFASYNAVDAAYSSYDELASDLP